jgi:hypothetical protein
MTFSDERSEKKKKITNILIIIGLIFCGLSTLTGAFVGGSDGSASGGALYGFLIGLAGLALTAFLVRSIDDPSLLGYFLICVPLGFFIGYIWGWNGAKIGAAIGAVIAFLFVADMIKTD